MPNDHHSLEGVNIAPGASAPFVVAMDQKLTNQISDVHCRVSALEERIKTLEAFHHWAAVQIYPDIKTRIEDLERVTQEQYQRLAKAISGHEEILARIERRFAEELQQQRIDPGVLQQKAEFGPDAGQKQQQGYQTTGLPLPNHPAR